MKVVSWKKLNYHQKSVVSSLLFSSITLLLIFVLGDSQLITNPTWYLDLLPVIGLVGSHVSGPSYIAKLADFLKNKKNNAETKFTLLGLLLALSFGIALTVLTPFSKILQPLLTFCSTFSLFSGFFSRLGTTIHKENNRPALEKRLIQICALLSLGLSVFLIATSAIALVSVVGVTSGMSGGSVLPIGLGAFFFACSFSGAYVQTGEYLGKTLSLGLTPTHAGIKNKKNEYTGSALGLSLGVIIGIIVITALAISQPYIFATAFLAIVVGSLIFATCAGTTASLCSKLGKAIDFPSQSAETTSSSSISRRLNNSFSESHSLSSVENLVSPSSEEAEDRPTLSSVSNPRESSENGTSNINEQSSLQNTTIAEDSLSSATSLSITSSKNLSSGIFSEAYSPNLFSLKKSQSFTKIPSKAKNLYYPMERSLSFS